ncbi:MAG: hypothetical protein IPP29_17795 [Bacteroidetes bacterium]|nr:hypothetical protein [Bacteroidota bacterium]
MRKILLFLFILTSVSAIAQKSSNNKLVQFTGVVVTNDSLQPIPFASVMVRRTNTGTLPTIMDSFLLWHAKAIR